MRVPSASELLPGDGREALDEPVRRAGTPGQDGGHGLDVFPDVPSKQDWGW
jgi:hypothetical protein